MNYMIHMNNDMINDESINMGNDYESTKKNKNCWCTIFGLFNSQAQRNGRTLCKMTSDTTRACQRVNVDTGELTSSEPSADSAEFSNDR